MNPMQSPNIGVGGKDHGYRRSSQEELNAFIGLNDSYIEMDRKNAERAPKCHFTPMSLHQGDGENYANQWWECHHCGHTKDFI